MPCEYEKECELVKELGKVVSAVYCSSNGYEFCPVYALRKELGEVRNENLLLRKSESIYREQVATGLEKIIEIAREMQR